MIKIFDILRREPHNVYICKTKSNIRLTSGSLKAHMLRSVTRQKRPPLKFLFSIIMELAVKRIGEQNKKLHQNRKGENKTNSICR